MPSEETGQEWSQERIQQAANEKRRRYLREYMRRRRADRGYYDQERENRLHIYYERKSEDASSARLPYTDDNGRSVCGLCRQLPAVGEIARLRVCKNSPDGYVEIRIPYCGEC